MNPYRTHLVVLMVAAVLAGCDGDSEPVETIPPPPAPVPPNPAASTNAVILEWNRLLTEAQGAGNLFSFRQHAILHIAMFDAANSVRRLFNPYRLTVANASSLASEEAAAAQAGRDVLVAFFPAAAATFDAALATRLGTLTQPATDLGVDIGKQAAAAVLAWRSDDGASTPDPAYTQPALPGLWQPTAPGQVAAGTRFVNLRPFALLTASQYLPAPPPPLNSAEYAANFQRVYDIGSVNSVVRTAEQTQLARLIAGVGFRPGPFALWNSLARAQAESRQLSLIETARLFALLNVAMQDGLHTSVNSKYVYNLWRPVTAIARAFEDANDATAPDATWVPLLGTPPYPSHASNVACFGTSAARLLARTLGTDQTPFSLTWTWTGAAGAGTDVTRQYQAFSQLSDEAGASRVYGGIHFEFEITAANVACRKVADYVFDNYLKAR